MEIDQFQPEGASASAPDSENREGASSLKPSAFPKFVKPMRAVKRLEGYVGTSLAAKQMIVDKMRDGKLRAFARWTWESSEPSLKKAWSAVPEGAQEKAQIRRDRLLASPTWLNDLTRWKWNDGDFFCGGNKPDYRTIYKDVRFVAEDVEKLVQAAKDALRELKRGHGGAKPKEGARQDVWLAMIELSAKQGPLAFEPHGKAVDRVVDCVRWSQPKRGGKAVQKETLGPDEIGKMVTEVRKRLGLT